MVFPQESDHSLRDTSDDDAVLSVLARRDLPAPSAQFRRRAWLEFQRALDPLGPPRPLRLQRH